MHLEVQRLMGNSKAFEIHHEPTVEPNDTKRARIVSASRKLREKLKNLKRSLYSPSELHKAKRTDTKKSRKACEDTQGAWKFRTREKRFGQVVLAWRIESVFLCRENCSKSSFEHVMRTERVLRRHCENKDVRLAYTTNPSPTRQEPGSSPANLRHRSHRKLQQ